MLEWFTGFAIGFAEHAIPLGQIQFWLAAKLNLDAWGLTICLAVIFVAGVVRGFSGFALSALVMASLAVMLPPIELIAVCWFLEMSASLLMVRGGVKQWDRSVVTGLVIGSTIGSPIGLYFTNTLSIETSKATALVIIMVLAILQLLKVRAPFLSTTPGVYFAGVTAGIATGLASVGGLVVALFVLARDAPAQVMRASLVMFLFIGSLMSFIFLYLYGMMNELSVARGLLFAPVAMLGVLAGQLLFRPSLERYYKPFCLLLLVGLASAGLIRLGMSV